MSGFEVRPEALNYLTAAALDFGTLPEQRAWQPVPAVGRRLAAVRAVGIGDVEHDPTDPVAAPLSEPLLAGLAGESIPFAFEVLSGAGGVRFSVGTWVSGPSETLLLDEQHGVVTSLLDGLFAGVDLDPAPVDNIGMLSVAGIAHGVPRADMSAGPAPWDRLLRSMQGLPFAVLVLAQPIDPSTLTALRDVALDDLRAAEAAEDPRGPSPLAKAYATKVDALVATLERALAIGGWRTGVYLLGDASSYWQLAAAWRATFTDASAALPPVRVATTPAAARAAAMWAMPYVPAPPGPRGWRHPFRNQTLLDSRQLAAFAHLPRLDTPGFTVRPAPAFAVSRPAPASDRSVAVGEILAQRRPTGSAYRIDLDQLTRHAFIAGLTGAGKTNTLMHVLTEAAAAGVPFLVIEPAKTEYRELLGRPEFGSAVRVFTIGREHVSPLRLNPFDVPPGVDVATHLDLLKAVFMGSFALWVPLPQILEQCLVDLYTERGWDFAAGPVEGPAHPVPTLGDLVEAVERTVPSLGYKAESTQEITAALTTRLNALRRGTRGLMLDVERSVPMGELLSAPTILELEGLGDDADKAFVMGLVLTRLYEHRRAEHAAALTAGAHGGQPPPPSGLLRHIVVVEEAHRLLTASKKSTDSWTADPQGAFSDTFGQMLSEVRAYGQGVVIADQVPVRLAPDVLKNTNLKVVHRLVAGDDRAAVAAAMSMSEAQSNQLAVLPPGRAAVFSEGDHTPVIVQVPRAKDRPDARPVDDAAVASAMQRWRTNPPVAVWYAASGACAEVCRDATVCRAGRLLAEQPAARLLAGRLFSTAAEHPDGFDVVWPDVESYVRARTQFDLDLTPRLHAFAVHALARVTARRAVQARWSDDGVRRLDSLARDLVAERMASGQRWLGATAARSAFAACVAELQRRRHDPFRLCTRVCPDGRCAHLGALTDARLTARHEVLVARPDWEPATLVGAATSLAQDVTEIDSDAPAGANALNAARWRAIACAAQLLESDTDHATTAATRVTAALSDAGWQI
jgi:Helicase HerA, central domain